MAFLVLLVALGCIMWLTEVSVAKGASPSNCQEECTHAAGVSLVFRGETLPSDSFVDFDDVLNIGDFPPAPTNRAPARDGAVLQCITDLVDCCGTESGSPVQRTERGNWYFPNGTRVGEFGGGTRFLVNRGPSEVINGQQFNGSVRLFRRYSAITERGRFRCELPNAADPSVNQTLYVNILNFGFRFNVSHVIISPSTGSTNTTAGERDYSLNCSATLFEPTSLIPQSGIPSPNFQWFLNGCASLPSGVTAMPTFMSSSNSTSETYTSTLEISSLSQCNVGMYTCRLGPARLTSNVMVTMDGLSPITVSVEIITSGAMMLGQNYSLICNVTVTGADAGNSSITYQWTKNNGCRTQVGTDRVLSFSPLRLSDAGWYTCQATVGPCNITEMDTQDITLQKPSISVLINSSGAPILGQSNYSLECIVNGTDRLGLTINTYQWTKNNGTNVESEQILGENSAILPFSNPLKLSDAGQYTCRVNASYNSSYLDKILVVEDLDTLNITLEIPGPTNVSIISDQDNPIRPIGSTVNVTCVACIDLSNRPEIDVPLTIIIQLAGPEFERTLLESIDMQSDHTYTSSAMISSFGRNHSGSYECIINITTPTIFLVEHTSSKSVHIMITTDVGVYLLQGQTIYSNNSFIFIEETTKLRIQCVTDKRPCCATPLNGFGEWQFPNKTNIGISTGTASFYRSKGDDGTVNLHQVTTSTGNIIFPTGLFCCIVPDADNVTQTMCINIVAVNLTDNGATPVLGRSYALNCSAYSTSTTTFQWKKDHDALQNVSEQLFLFPNLSLSDAGNYTCIVNRNGVMYNSSLAIILHVPHPASVTIRSDPTYPIILGSAVIINCVVELDPSVVESELSLLMVDAQLSRDGTPLNPLNVTIFGTTFTYATMINSFGKKDSGNYTCTANVGSNSSYLYGNTSGSINVSISYHELEMDQSPTSTVGVILGVLFVTVFLILGSALAVAVGLRRKLKVKVLNLKSQRPRLQYLGDHDYVTHTVEPHEHQEGHGKNHHSEGESLELNENEETQTDKDKDYYFMDTTLIAGERVKPIPVSEFSSHVERLHADRDKLFEMEYESVSKHPQSSYSVAEIPHNKLKNRFANIFPYDSSRVKLKEISGEDGSDYINASHLDGYNKPKAYIGAQGPMSNTVSDFWRMIWEKKLPTVVMLTRVFEGRKKCEEYWPLNVDESVHPGHGLTITLNSTLPFAEYSLRKMTLTSSTAPGSAPLKVTQYHFTGWPDHGVPQNGITLINFIRRVRTSHPYSDSRPLLVHCSAGVGRTGAFIVLDSMLQRMQGEQNLNIYEFFKQLRTQRVLMVQTQAQYNFIHDALNELILCGDTEITAPNLRIVISRLNKTTDGETGYTKQFNLIAQMSPGYSESDYTQAKMECNLSKNRYPNVLPNDRHRVLLRAAAGSDYINASFIDGYRQRGGYIATQAPMENTVNDFWRMVWDYQSRAIVMLCRMKEDGKEACCPFLPEHKGDSEVYGRIRVKLVSKETTTDYVIQQLEVSEDKPHPQGHASSETAVKVGLFHYIRWPKHGTPRGTAALLDLIQHINKTQMTSGNKPITVMCNDGVGRTGTFICIHAQLERLKTEGVVDFFQSIKSARIQRAGLVPDVHQYIFCHNLVADYLDGFDTYANFKELV